MGEQSQYTARVSDLVSACISGLGAMAIMSYVAKVTTPGIIDAVLALISVGAVVGAYLCVARANVDPWWKAIILIGGAGACLLDLRFLS
jgi:hypothetical protein